MRSCLLVLLTRLHGNMTMTCDELKVAAFESHSVCYMDSYISLCDLPVTDYIILLYNLDLYKDFLGNNRNLAIPQVVIFFIYKSRFVRKKIAICTKEGHPIQPHSTQIILSRNFILNLVPGFDQHHLFQTVLISHNPEAMPPGLRPILFCTWTTSYSPPFNPMSP